MSFAKSSLASTLKNRSWIFAIALGLIMLLFGLRLSSVNAQDVSINATQNCDANAVIWCGASSVSSLASSYVNGDGHNSAESIQAIYSNFGINAEDIQYMSNSSVQVVAGSVDRAGNVYDASGNKVATSAITAGRCDIDTSGNSQCQDSTASPGNNKVTVGNTTFYTRSPSVSFQQNSLSAYVVLINKTFSFAILASCGNPIKATPVEYYAPPAKKVIPTPTPNPISKPVQPIQPAPIQPIPPAKPVLPTPVTPATGECSSLGLIIDPSNPLSVNATVADELNNGATLSGISYNFGDNTAAIPSNETSLQHSYANAGTYTVTATLSFTGGPQAIPSSVCQSTITTNAATVLPVCNMLTLTEGDNRTVTVSNFQTTPNGASLINQDINWGDGTTVTGLSSVINQSHQYTADGTYTVTGDANYSVNGQTVTASGNGCTQQVTVTSTPTVTTASTTPTTVSTTLVNTGSGDTFIVFGTASIVGTLAYRFVLRRRLDRLRD
jgi:hypothetical protein